MCKQQQENKNKLTKQKHTKFSLALICFFLKNKNTISNLFSKSLSQDLRNVAVNISKRYRANYTTQTNSN